MTDRRKYLALAAAFAVGMLIVWPQLHPNQPAPAPGPRADVQAPVNAAPAAQGGQGDATYPTGYVPDEHGRDAFIRSLGGERKAKLETQAPGLFQGAQDTQPTLLYRSLYKASLECTGKPWVVGKQEIGDCVSWGWAHAADVALAVDYSIGKSGDWKPAATEVIYGGSRVEALGKKSNNGGDGSYGAAAAKWVVNYGLLYRQPYDGVDLTQYSGQRAKDWGRYGCGGKDDGGKLDGIAKSFPIKRVALVTTFKEAAAAIQSGYPVAVCSMQGFAKHRDKDGFAKAQGQWAHCMCFIGVRFDRPALLCLNSWSTDWIDGPKYPSDQPDGTFWVEERTADGMLGKKDSFAVSEQFDFARRKINHGDGL